jgi:RNA polymerase sigma factor (sigma-70 family)
VVPRQFNDRRVVRCSLRVKADTIPTRKSLLGRLVDWRDEKSWRAFFDTYWRLIYGFALKHGLTHEEAEEVVQETVLAVARGLPRFSYDPAKCGFKTWLFSVTRSKIANQQARRVRNAGVLTDPPTCTGTSTSLADRVPDDQAQDRWIGLWDDEWRQTLVDRALRRVKERVSIEHFQIFDLFVLKGWPARDVARTLGVSRALVYVTKLRLSRMLRAEAEAFRSEEP